MPVASTDYPRGSGARKKGPLTAADMLNRVDQRLRRLVTRACRNSYAAAKVVELFEEFIVASFGEKTVRLKSLDESWWKNLLLECPTITQRNDNHRCTAHFLFHATAPTGGFHRLLLHAVCQFHGLHANLRTEHNFAIADVVTDTRVLVVNGNVDEPSRYRLSQHLADEVEDSSTAIHVVEPMNALRV